MPGGIKMETVAYGGWENCIRVSNEEIELIVTTDVGPRIIRFGFIGEQNEFCEIEDDLGKTGGDKWRLYGGHRLWHAPEIQPRAYHPDDVPVEHTVEDGALCVTAPVESTSGIQKQIRIKMNGGRNTVRVDHVLTNHNAWPITLAPWSLSVMAPGGRAIIPQEPFRPHTEALLPARPMVLWYYTAMNDPRWTWGGKFIQLSQDSEAETPLKLGARVGPGWAAYVNGDHVFIKSFEVIDGGEYPDFGCNAEFFTNETMLEIESLGPMTPLEPGEGVGHTETWKLARGIEVGDTDDEIAQALEPLR